LPLCKRLLLRLDFIHGLQIPCRAQLPDSNCRCRDERPAAAFGAWAGFEICAAEAAKETA
jgi:hypothetical protein